MIISLLKVEKQKETNEKSMSQKILQVKREKLQMKMK
jgi:hypothetical protein